MDKRDKRVIFGVIVWSMVIILGIGAALTFYIHKKAEERDRLIGLLYKQQNFALAMHADSFIGFDTLRNDLLRRNLLRVRLAAYEEATGSIVTLEDVEGFLSSEYTKSGDLLLFERPEKIDSYINWFWSGGELYSCRYFDCLISYRKDNPDDLNVSIIEMPEDDLIVFLDGFKNCPDKERYKKENITGWVAEKYEG